MTVAAPHGPGSRLSVTVIAEGPGIRAEQAYEITAAEPGWTIWMVCHFHYDPVWWNTQGGFTEAGLAMPGEDGTLPDVRTAFELVRLHLDAARDDPDYKFVLAEVDYLKPYFDAHPEDRAELRELIAAGRAELVGGAYNEPNTNLTSAESTIRNIVYGLGHQRDVLGADPSVAWALDAFGHDPGYPGLMAAAGMTGSAWARGPYHQWGPWRTVGDNARMQFPSEFEWISPDGRGLLTSYMANHYGAGWVIHQAADLAAAKQEALGQLALLAPVAATRNVLLPVGADHVIPPRWATAVHRDFAARYAWPRCVTGLPREFFAAVRAEAAERGIWLTPQTRDMNPVYPGKDVSYIDTKQAQRAAEVAVSDGERLATLAWLAGAGYPAESLDKAWRQLVFGAHHDAITGTESDQVYLDLLGGWREAFERGEEVREEAAGFLAGLVNTRQQYATTGASGDPPGRTVVVFNTLSWPRAGLAARTLEFAAPGPPWLALTDETGAGVPFLAEGIRRHPDHSLASVRITFLAEVPALGYRSYWVSAAPAPRRARLPREPGSGADPAAAAAGWATLLGTVIGNDTFEVAADPARGGGLSRVLDRRTGTALLRGLGNELVLAEEYPAHPRWGEGPWLLCPKGPGNRFWRRAGEGVRAALPARLPAGGAVPARRSAGHPGDHPVGRPGPGGVPHARGRVDRAGPAAAGPLPRAGARRAPGVPVRHRRGRAPVRGGRLRRGEGRLHPGQPGLRVVRPEQRRAGVGGRPHLGGRSGRGHPPGRPRRERPWRRGHGYRWRGRGCDSQAPRRARIFTFMAGSVRAGRPRARWRAGGPGSGPWSPRWRPPGSRRPAPARTARVTARSTWTRTCPTSGSRSAAPMSIRGRPGCSPRSAPRGQVPPPGWPPRAAHGSGFPRRAPARRCSPRTRTSAGTATSRC